MIRQIHLSRRGVFLLIALGGIGGASPFFVTEGEPPQYDTSRFPSEATLAAGAMNLEIFGLGEERVLFKGWIELENGMIRSGTVESGLAVSDLGSHRLSGARGSFGRIKVHYSADSETAFQSTPTILQTSLSSGSLPDIMIYVSLPDLNLDLRSSSPHALRLCSSTSFSPAIQGALCSQEAFDLIDANVGVMRARLTQMVIDVGPDVECVDTSADLTWSLKGIRETIGLVGASYVIRSPAFRGGEPGSQQELGLVEMTLTGIAPNHDPSMPRQRFYSSPSSNALTVSSETTASPGDLSHISVLLTSLGNRVSTTITGWMDGRSGNRAELPDLTSGSMRSVALVSDSASGDAELESLKYTWIDGMTQCVALAGFETEAGCATISCVEFTDCEGCDQNACTNDFCVLGRCQSGGIGCGFCNDGDPCTIDSCVRTTRPCLPGDRCDASDPECIGCETYCVRCEHTPKCETRNDACIMDCNSEGTCYSSVPVGTTCDDGKRCTEGDSCDGEGNCVGGPQVLCPDDPCGTNERCVEPGLCVSDPVICADTPCLTGERCELGDCVGDVTPGASCDDGMPCTEPDTCDGSGACVGTPKLCVDAQCRINERCNPLTGGCEGDVEPPGTPCSDGMACTFDECDGRGCVNRLWRAMI